MRFIFSQIILMSMFLEAIAEIKGPPIVDISILRTATDMTDVVVKSCVHEIDMALQTYGLFIAIGHGIETKTFSEGFEAANNMFDLSLDQKLNVSMNSVGGIGRGYLPFGIEAGVSSYFEPKEGYSYGYEWTNASPSLHPLQRENVWPRSLDKASKEQLQKIFNDTVDVAKLLTDALASSHANNVNYSEVVRGGETISLMRLFHYFSPEENDYGASEKVKTMIGSSPHTDWVSADLT